MGSSDKETKEGLLQSNGRNVMAHGNLEARGVGGLRAVV